MTSLTTRGRFAPIIEVCPDCKGEMTVIEVRPLRFIDGVESITYKCKRCRLEKSWIFQSPPSPSDRTAALRLSDASKHASAHQGM
jgi:hypothetical protein